MTTLKKALLIGSAASFLIVAGFFIWASSGNSGQITDASKRAPIRRVVAPQTYDGNFVSFQYSPKYQLQKLVAADNDLELARLVANTNYDKRLAVAISKLPSSSLTSNSAYLLRTSQPTKYTQTKQVVDGLMAETWSTNDGLERVVFLPKGDKVAVLSFSTTSQSDDLESEAASLLSTLRWKDRP